jgi:hypothetical protein
VGGFTRTRLALAAGFAAVVAAAAAVVSTGAHPAGSAPLTARELAYRASTAVLAGPAVSPGQWVYEKSEVGGNGKVSRGTTRESWQTADGLRTAWVDGYGQLHVGPNANPDVISYAELKSLPPNPKALIEYVYRIEIKLGEQPPAKKGVKPGKPTTDPGFAFGEISNLLGEYVLPPRLTAAAFQALAGIPGVTVDQNAVTLAGIHGVGFVYRPDSSFELILNSRSDYGVIGFKSEGAGRYTKDWAVLAQAFVSGPGVRP